MLTFPLHHRPDSGLTIRPVTIHERPQRQLPAVLFLPARRELSARDPSDQPDDSQRYRTVPRYYRTPSRLKICSQVSRRSPGPALTSPGKHRSRRRRAHQRDQSPFAPSCPLLALRLCALDLGPSAVPFTTAGKMEPAVDELRGEVGIWMLMVLARNDAGRRTEPAAALRAHDVLRR